MVEMSILSEKQHRGMRRQVKSLEKIFWVVFALAALLCVVLYYGQLFSLKSGNGPETFPATETFDNAAVAADAGNCSEIGKQILMKGGSVVDAAIAAMLCVGVYNSHSCGLGGGFFMTIYNATTGTATIIDARDVAPNLASRDMYGKEELLSEIGTLAVAVPGQIAGFWEAHQRFGKLPWKDLFEPSIKIAEKGYVVGTAHAEAIALIAPNVLDRDLNLWPVFTNLDGSLKKAGDTIRRPQLAATLRTIADKGADVFYRGSLASDIVADLRDGYVLKPGGESIMTETDLDNYRTNVKPALNVTVGDFSLFAPGPPASGSVLALILNILEGYNFSRNDMKPEQKILTYHRFVEAFHFAYVRRSWLGDDRTNKTITEIAINMTSKLYAESLRLKINDSFTQEPGYYDEQFVLSDDRGTSHLCVVGPGGHAVSMTSSINAHFGSKVRGRRTGIIFNNDMNDFSLPGLQSRHGLPESPSNYIVPGNRPFSSMCPSVITQTDPQTGKRELKMVAGAAGGPKITTTTALVIMNSLFFGDDVGTSVAKKRIHYQLGEPVKVETGFDKEIVDGLEMKGHEVEVDEGIFAVVQAILVDKDGRLSAACDSRKGGYPSGF
ncbi:glutathione hydrolase 1 proenzyme-like isoform X2 [Clavelina lepadiformis]|uniref:glutathione hydrolase 1 proenzyme-like isoform X2 n=1 Tax=Clavelina lepadiformis TaxID=159417 RepID=UPI0040431723